VTARLTRLLCERKGTLLALVTLHAFVVHWFFLGAVSWDGFTYRVPPIVELVQSGHLGLEKYNQWAFPGYVPFLELSHYPFLAAFGQAGFVIGWPLVAFPLSVWAIFLFVREVTKDELAGVLGGLAYAALPFANQQPFSGYVDFAVCGVIAFFVYALLRAGGDERPWRWSSRIALASLVFSMSRSQGVYVGALLVPIVLAATHVRWASWRPKAIDLRRAAGVALAFGVGCVPAIAVQIWRYRRWGSPIFPFRLELPGVVIGQGMSRFTLFSFGGLENETPGAYLRGFAAGWLWPRNWPLSGFFDSRDMGGGFVFYAALLVLPVFALRAQRRTAYVALALAAVSILAKDFWLPRYGYCFVLAVVLAAGSGLALAATLPRASALFWIGAALLALHLLRPEWDVTMLEKAYGVGPRLDVTSSSSFVAGPDTVEMYPDRGARFVILDLNYRGFLMPLYGPKLTNRVVRTIPIQDIGARCAGLGNDGPDVLYVDDQDLAKDCKRECAITAPSGSGRCMAYRIEPER